MVPGGIYPPFGAFIAPKPSAAVSAGDRSLCHRTDRCVVSPRPFCTAPFGRVKAGIHEGQRNSQSHSSTVFGRRLGAGGNDRRCFSLLRRCPDNFRILFVIR